MRQKLEYKEAEAMLRSGKTQQEVADRFGVKQGTVAAALNRGNINLEGSTAGMENRIPWTPVRPEHRSRYLITMLRALQRRERGLKQTALQDARLDAFLEEMAERDAVVHYDPDTEAGFFRVLRRHDVDTWMVRDPYLEDDGSPVVSPTGVRKRDR